MDISNTQLRKILGEEEKNFGSVRVKFHVYHCDKCGSHEFDVLYNPHRLKCSNCGKVLLTHQV